MARIVIEVDRQIPMKPSASPQNQNMNQNQNQNQFYFRVNVKPLDLCKTFRIRSEASGRLSSSKRRENHVSSRTPRRRHPRLGQRLCAPARSLTHGWRDRHQDGRMLSPHFGRRGCFLHPHSPRRPPRRCIGNPCTHARHQGGKRHPVRRV